MNQETGICEWIAPKRPPAPTTERTTRGTETCSPVRYQYFVDWLTRLSIASVRKSPNMISITGRSPVDGRSERGAGERELRDRSVEDPLAPVLVVEARRDREYPSRDRDVLTEEDDPVVCGELLVEGLADGGAEVDRGRGHRSRLLEEEGQWVLEQAAQMPEEPCRIGAVDDAVIGCQRHSGEIAEDDSA